MAWWVLPALMPPPSRFAPWLDRWFRPLALIGVLLNLSGLPIPLMEPDAALYATVARHMAESGDAVNLISQNTDWLDKPHFPFWLTALSFRLFGVDAVAYKLPGLGCWALGVVYTYLFARRFYSLAVARLAVLLLLTAQHLIMSNNDVRAEPFLMGLLMGALYHLARARERRFSLHLVPGALLAACAAMTKGPFVLITLVGGLAFHWARRREWREFGHPRWWLALALTGLFLLPELYCLRQQFDLHPEKELFGRTGVSGVRFFFWDSQFGRFLNTGPIQGKGHPLFFLHTVLWAFLPWSTWLYAAVFRALLPSRRAAQALPPEDYTLGAAGLTFLLFSLSRFQLPYYTNILFPFFSLLTAAWLDGLSEPGARVAAGLQAAVAGLMFLGAPVLLGFTASSLAPGGLWAGGLGLVGCGALALRCFPRAGLPDAVGRSVGAAVALNAVANGLFYPALLRYQAAEELASFLARQSPRPTGLYGINSFALEFHWPAPLPRWSLADLQASARAAPLYVVLEEAAVGELTGAGLAVHPLRTFDNYRVTRLTGRFLNPATRSGTLQKVLVAEVTNTPP